jgi:hypothetical protein
MDKDKTQVTESKYDFTIVFDKLKTEIESQPETFSIHLEESNDTIQTIALFRDFQESSYPQPASFYSRS